MPSPHSMPRPKGVIFDLGGVLITSPLKAIQEFEAENNIPFGYLNYAISTAEPNAWAELEMGKLRTDKTFYSRWSKDLASPKAWKDFHRMKGLEVRDQPPRVDGKVLLRRMIIPKEGGKLIPETFTALKRLKQHGVITCGLTNNFIIEKDSEYLPLAELSAKLLPYFTRFLESAVLGIRKPNPAIFKYALKTMGLEPGEVVFLDDIGSNLKAAENLGIRCIRVRIENEGEAVRELEQIMGIKLSEEKARL